MLCDVPVPLRVRVAVPDGDIVLAAEPVLLSDAPRDDEGEGEGVLESVVLPLAETDPVCVRETVLEKEGDSVGEDVSAPVIVCVTVAVKVAGGVKEGVEVCTAEGK